MSVYRLLRTEFLTILTAAETTIRCQRHDPLSENLRLVRCKSLAQSAQASQKKTGRMWALFPSIHRPQRSGTQTKNRVLCSLCYREVADFDRGQAREQETTTRYGRTNALPIRGIRVAWRSNRQFRQIESRFRSAAVVPAGSQSSAACNEQDLPRHRCERI